MARDQRQARWVAEQHRRARGTDPGDEVVQIGGRHFECRQQVAAQQCVAEPAHTVLRTELDRAAPDHQFGIADVDTPPAGGAPLGRHVVALARQTGVEDQRLTRRSAGVVARQRTMIGGFHRLGMGADLGLAQHRQPRQIGHRNHRRRVETAGGEAGLVVRHVVADVVQELLQIGQLQRRQFVGRQPLAALELAAPGHAVVALEPLVKRKEHRAGQAREAHRKTRVGAQRGPGRGGLTRVTKIQPRRMRKAWKRRMSFSNAVPMRNSRPLNIK